MSNYYGPGGHDLRSWIGWLLAVVVVLIVAIPLLFALDWLSVGLDTVGPERMRQLSREANDRYEALEAQRSSIRIVEDKASELVATYGEDRSAWPQGKREEYLQLQSQIANLEVAYNNACAQYRAMWADEWRDLPAPDDLPTTCEMRH